MGKGLSYQYILAAIRFTGITLGESEECIMIMNHASKRIWLMPPEVPSYL